MTTKRGIFVIKNDVMPTGCTVSGISIAICSADQP
jgi:hypothetical protein